MATSKPKGNSAVKNVSSAKKTQKKPVSSKTAVAPAAPKTSEKKPPQPTKTAQQGAKTKNLTTTSGIQFPGGSFGIVTVSSPPRLTAAEGTRIQGKASADAAQKTLTRPSGRRLSKKEIEKIRIQLLERQELLIEGLHREKGMQSELSQQRVADEADVADKTLNEDMSFEIASAKHQELKDIKTALERIDSGSYGKCEVCGCEIPPSRLKVLPSATTCKDCRGQEELLRSRDESRMFSLGAGDEPDAGADQ